MRWRLLISAVSLGGTLALSACASTQARLHSKEELSAVERACGLALGELIQDESEKRLLFLFRFSPTPEERACVVRWARKNHMRAVIIEAANEPVG